jgi:hypothetical protein
MRPCWPGLAAHILDTYASSPRGVFAKVAAVQGAGIVVASGDGVRKAEPMRARSDDGIHRENKSRGCMVLS